VILRLLKGTGILKKNYTYYIETQLIKEVFVLTIYTI